MKRDELLALYEDDQRNFRGADLSKANLYMADLSGADLSGANLHGANLRGANLHGADLYGADLYGADLSGANLYGAELRWANLEGSDLTFCLGVFYANDGGHQITLIPGDTPMIHAGCRWFTIEEAREHWYRGNMGAWTTKTPEYGEGRRAILEFLIARAGL